MRVDRWVQDWLFQRPGVTSGNIVIIGIDEEALDILGPYHTWTREIVAQALEALSADPEKKPAVTAIDILYSGNISSQADERLAEANTDTVMPGYTHLQRAQPVTFAHHLMAYAMMFLRDIGRLRDARKRMNVSPLGCCALAGTTFPTDRGDAAERLGFDGLCENSIDGVSDRDYCVELLSAFSLIMTHLSRFAEEIVLWSSWEFRFIELDDSFTTGSSIMTQKKNPYMAELVRGKTGRVYGDLIGTLTMLKGLPLAYNKDMQEDKESIFDALDTVKACLSVFIPMIAAIRPRPEIMYRAAQQGFLNATDLADYLVGKGRPFREAYKTVGRLVAVCIERGTVLDELPLSVYKEYDPLFDGDLYGTISPEACVSHRRSVGGCSKEAFGRQLAFVKKELAAAEAADAEKKEPEA